jgi:hypothetical protein
MALPIRHAGAVGPRNRARICEGPVTPCECRPGDRCRLAEGCKISACDWAIAQHGGIVLRPRVVGLDLDGFLRDCETDILRELERES